MIDKTKLWYLAHPYTGKIRRNIEHCIEISNNLLDRGYNLFIPILMSDPLDKQKPRKRSFWINYDKIFMDRCDGLILSGNWYSSKGCLIEKKYFEKQNKEIIYYGGEKL